MHTRLHTLEGVAAFLVLGIIYGLVSARFAVGPPWLLLALTIIGSATMAVLYYKRWLHARRMVSLTLTAIVTIVVAMSAILLVQGLLAGRAEAAGLLFSAGLVWCSNIIAFTLWYWELDAGGPHMRHTSKVVSTDFLFPQMVAGGERRLNWCPEFLDYLFLAFNTSTAFSPTDTMVLARRAKLLMMLQSLISLVTIAVLAARAINTL